MRQATRSTLLLACLVLYLSPSSVIAGMVLPPSFLQEEVLGDRYNPYTPNQLQMDMGGIARGSSNMGSLWDLDAHHQSPPTFHGDTVHVSGEGGGWVLFSYRRWMAGWGDGVRSAYDGNHDAGQLYLDLQSDNVPDRSYAPRASHVQANVSWWGIGREAPIGVGSVHGSVVLFARGIIVQNFLSQTLQGQVNGQDYTGMVRVVSAGGGSTGVPGIAPGGSSTGLGWAIDTRIHLQAGRYWEGFASVEGLAGHVYWPSAQFSDDYVTSTQVFTDPEGFKHTIWGGAQGATWRSSLDLPLDPVYRVDMVYRSSPNYLAGCLVEAGRADPSIGAAWPQRGPWSLYVRTYPLQGALELGSVGHGFQISIAADNLPQASIGHLTIAFTIMPTRF